MPTYTTRVRLSPDWEGKRLGNLILSEKTQIAWYKISLGLGYFLLNLFYYPVLTSDVYLLPDAGPASDYLRRTIHRLDISLALVRYTAIWAPVWLDTQSGCSEGKSIGNDSEISMAMFKMRLSASLLVRGSGALECRSGLRNGVPLTTFLAIDIQFPRINT